MSDPAATPTTGPQNLPSNVADVLAGRASPASLSEPAPEVGKATAPDAGKAGVEPSTPSTPATPAPDKGKPEPSPEVKPEDLEARMFGAETADQKLEKVTRDYKASSKEAQRQKARADKLAALFAEQNLEIVEEDGVPTHLAPGKGYSKDAAPLTIKFKDLPDEVQTLAADDPQKFVEHILRTAQKSLVRAAPTVEKAIRPLSDERKALAVQAVSDRKEMDGEAAFPNIKQDMPIIERFLRERPAMRDLYNQDPETALAILADHVAAERSRILAYSARLAAKEKAKASTTSPDTSPSNGGKPAIVEPKSFSDSMGKAIAAARY